MQPKAKRQQKRLSANVRQANANRADLKKSPTQSNKSSAKSKPPDKKQGGFFNGLAAKIFGGKPPKTAQESIPYLEMYRDGICRVTERLYTKTVVFGDINYFLADKESQTQIFEGYCDFLNCATRSHTTTIPQGIKLCGHSDHVVIKMGGFLQSMGATTYTLMSGMMG